MMENNREGTGCGGGSGGDGLGIVAEVDIKTDQHAEGEGHDDHDSVEEEKKDRESFWKGAHSRRVLLTHAEKSDLLNELLVEEVKLEKVVRDQKNSALGILVGLSKLVVEKQDEIDRLKKTIDLMKKKGAGEEKLEGGSEASSSSAVVSTFKKILEGEANEMGYPKYRAAELIFPEEIWEMMLKSLKSDDFRNALNACPLFNKILHPAKARHLFAFVFPHFCRYLDNRQVLKCRLVCKDWNDGVDNHVENHSSLRPFDQERFNPRDPDLQPPLKIAGRDLYRFRQFANHFKEQDYMDKLWDHPRNPFIGRAVTIQVFQDDEGIVIADMPPPVWPDVPVLVLPGWLGGQVGEIVVEIPEDEQPAQPHFYTNLFAFLAQFGGHIWYLTVELIRFDFSLPDWNGDSANVCEFLTSWIFYFAPNLRSLRIQGHVPAQWAEVDADSLVPAPKLESLMIANLQHVMGMGHGLAVDILIRKHHQQLKKLHVRWDTLHSLHLHREKGGSPQLWENLVELHVDGLVGEQNIKPIVSMKMPQLRKLVLTPGPNKMYNFETVMDIIINLLATTELQALRLFHGFQSEQLASSPATLFGPPSLKTLELEQWGWANFTLLLRFPFLENLIVFWAEDNVYERQGHEIRYKSGALPNLVNQSWSGDVIDGTGELAELHKFMFGRRVYECDLIWEMLPRLKVFTFQRDVYTRQGYELFLERKQKIKIKMDK